ncbi:MAG: CotH kinase family protein [Eggerthellaceae bacterium]|nr:CotH kinase family protein [Eggerthellaceae bacterium]
MFGMGKAKTWCLLANYADPSLMRNAVVSELGINAGVSYNPEGRFADLWVNGIYVGNY